MNNPILQKLLVHEVQWKNGQFSKPIVLKNVRIYASSKQLPGNTEITSTSSFVMDYDFTYSTPLPSGKQFSIGDTILWNQYPRIMQIANITPYFTTEGTPHHYTIDLRQN